jgi:hypothetical protein
VYILTIATSETEGKRRETSRTQARIICRRACRLNSDEGREGGEGGKASWVNTHRDRGGQERRGAVCVCLCGCLGRERHKQSVVADEERRRTTRGSTSLHHFFWASCEVSGGLS